MSVSTLSVFSAIIVDFEAFKLVGLKINRQFLREEKQKLGDSKEENTGSEGERDKLWEFFVFDPFP